MRVLPLTQAPFSGSHTAPLLGSWGRQDSHRGGFHCLSRSRPRKGQERKTPAELPAFGRRFLDKGRPGPGVLQGVKRLLATLWAARRPGEARGGGRGPAQGEGTAVALPGHVSCRVSASLGLSGCISKTGVRSKYPECKAPARCPCPEPVGRRVWGRGADGWEGLRTDSQRAPPPGRGRVRPGSMFASLGTQGLMTGSGQGPGI